MSEYRRSYKQQTNQQLEVNIMFRIVTIFALISAFLQIASLATARTDQERNPAQPVNAVIEWNRTLLAIVRTPGAQPATIHSTRNFAIWTPPSTMPSIISTQSSVRTLCAFPTFR